MVEWELQNAELLKGPGGDKDIFGKKRGKCNDCDKCEGYIQRRGIPMENDATVTECLRYALMLPNALIPVCAVGVRSCGCPCTSHVDVEIAQKNAAEEEGQYVFESQSHDLMVQLNLPKRYALG